MRARLLIEPMLAREAALNATSTDVEAFHRCLIRTREAATWRQYEAADNELHRCIAKASQNRLLLGLFDVLNSVRRAVVWPNMNASSRPLPSATLRRQDG